jgi:hypothetical protein
MQRRDFVKSTVAVAVGAELGMGKAQAKVSAHNWGSYDFGSGPTVNDRLNQGPFPGKIRQAQFVLPDTTDWKGLKLRAEVEGKGMRYPVRWACHQKLNDDGSLTLRPNLRQQI